MRAGKLDRVITISRSSIVIDAAGTPGREWNDVATLRAELIENAATETIGQAGAVTENLVLFRTRYLAGVTVADMINCEGNPYNIKEVKVIGRRRGLEIRSMRLGLL
jgi:SPP1 family predicted phage head-tail adaptor